MWPIKTGKGSGNCAQSWEADLAAACAVGTTGLWLQADACLRVPAVAGSTDPSP